MTKLLMNIKSCIKKFYTDLLDAEDDSFSLKELFNLVNAQCWFVLILTILFNAELWYKMLIIGDNTSVELIILNASMYVLWIFVELQYNSLKQIEKERK